MWLQKVVFDLQTKFFNKEQTTSNECKTQKTPRPERRTMDRAQLIQERLLDLDKRLEALQ